MARPHAVAFAAIVSCSLGCGALLGVDFDDAHPAATRDAGAAGAGDGSPPGSDAPGVSGSASAIAAGDSHVCAIVSGGAACWGMDRYGQLGDGLTSDSAVPVAVAGLGADVVAIGAGAFHSCAVVTGGGVRCWGRNDAGQLGDASSLASGYTAVTGGNSHTCAITTARGVRCWGKNASGQLGSAGAPSGPTPVDVAGLAGVIAVAASGDFTCALTDAGAVMCWGSNYMGSLGTGSSADADPTPAVAMGLAAGAMAIAAGDTHACALVGGGVACWGSNTFGELGTDSPSERNTPASVPGLAGVVGVAAGGDAVADDHSCAVVMGGGVKCWGINDNGQLGSNAGPLGGSVPGDVVGLSTAAAVSAGAGFTCALTTTGGVKCWGSNDHGQLGNGSSVTMSAGPVDVSL
jgi:alpha-tubulin suppressor-like RCC1 family protein